ncbi:hypothetical protein OSTOST_17766, partial [Ostertagia ostertagi]
MWTRRHTGGRGWHGTAARAEESVQSNGASKSIPAQSIPKGDMTRNAVPRTLFVTCGKTAAMTVMVEKCERRTRRWMDRSAVGNRVVEMGEIRFRPQPTTAPISTRDVNQEIQSSVRSSVNQHLSVHSGKIATIASTTIVHYGIPIRCAC